jgi:hypothetical protein
VAERLKAGSLVALEVDLVAVVIQNLLLLAQQAQQDLEGLQEDQVAFVVASVEVSMVVVVEVASEAASRIAQAMVVDEEVLAIKAEEALRLKEDTEVAAAEVAQVEIAVGMAAMRHQMLLLDLEAAVAVAFPQVGMDVVATAVQAPPLIEMAQRQLDPRRQLEVGMILVAHMMTDPVAAIVAAAVAAMATVVEIHGLVVAAATWSR